MPKDSTAYYTAIVNDPKSNEDLLEAYTFFKQVQKDHQSHHRPMEEVRALVYISKAQRQIGDYSDAEQSSIEALRLLETQDSTSSDVKTYKALYYNQLGMLYREQKDYERSRLFYKKSLTNISDPTSVAIIENNIGYTYRAEENYQQAISHFQKSLDLFDEVQDSSSFNRARSLCNLGFAQVHLNKAEGFDNMKIALEMHEQENYFTGKFACLLDLSLGYLHMNNLEMAREFANKTYALASDTKNTYWLLRAMELQLDVGEYQNYPKYKQLNDSITTLKQFNKNQYAALKYQNEQALTDAKEAQLKFEKAQSLKTIAMLVSIFILSSAVLSFFFLRTKNRKQTLEEVLRTESRISQQIHDEVANEVFQVMTKLEEQGLQDPSLVDDMEMIYSKTRDISKEYNLVSKEEDFAETLKDMIQNFSNEEHRIITNGLSDIQWTRVSELKCTAFYKVLQELLINMRKHSKASLVALQFHQKGKHINMSYTDNGIGGDISKGAGLKNAENRIRAVGGSLTFESTIHSGFKAELYV
jgi:signal transduction histidine kinase